jgi:hypothetical protein
VEYTQIESYDYPGAEEDESDSSGGGSGGGGSESSFGPNEENDKDCDDFDTHREAQQFYESTDIKNGLDRDGDGRACESLP